MKNLFVLIPFLVVFLSGCFASMSKEDVEVYKLQAAQQTELIKYHAALAEKPTYEAKCDGPCNIKIFDGDELPDLPVLQHFVGPHEANARMWESGADVAKTGVMWGAATKITSDIVDGLGDGDNNHSTNTINGDDNQISRTDNHVDSKSSVSSGDVDTTTDNSSRSSVSSGDVATTTDNSSRSLIKNDTRNSNNTTDRNDVINNDDNSRVTNPIVKP